jgi:hypothetical protein
MTLAQSINTVDVEPQRAARDRSRNMLVGAIAAEMARECSSSSRSENPGERVLDFRGRGAGRADA